MCITTQLQHNNTNHTKHNNTVCSSMGHTYPRHWAFVRRIYRSPVDSPHNTVGQRKKVTAVTFFPARPRPDQRGTNTDRIRKVPLYEIAWFFVYRRGETAYRLSANNGILVCLVRGIWQFKVFAGKEVTAVPATRGEGGYWRRGRRLLCLCWNWIALSFLKHWE